jgi:hypothetical protein
MYFTSFRRINLPIPHNVPQPTKNRYEKRKGFHTGIVFLTSHNTDRSLIVAAVLALDNRDNSPQTDHAEYGLST